MDITHPALHTYFQGWKCAKIKRYLESVKMHRRHFILLCMKRIKSEMLHLNCIWSLFSQQMPLESTECYINIKLLLIRPWQWMRHTKCDQARFHVIVKFGTSLHIIGSRNIDKVTMLSSTHACTHIERERGRKKKRRGLI